MFTISFHIFFHRKDIEYLHNVLMIASERLNDLYSWSLLLWLGNLCLHIVSGLYFIMTRLMSWNIYEWRVISCLIAWLASFLGQLTLLTFTCDFTAFEASSNHFHYVLEKKMQKLLRFYFVFNYYTCIRDYTCIQTVCVDVVAY